MAQSEIAVGVPSTLLAELSQYVEKTGRSKTDVIVSAICLQQRFAIAQSLRYAEHVLLSQRMAELETKVKELQTLVKEWFSEEGKQFP